MAGLVPAMNVDARDPATLAPRASARYESAEAHQREGGNNSGHDGDQLQFELIRPSAVAHRASPPQRLPAARRVDGVATSWCRQPRDGG
jgi:hypothetical protein